MLAVTYDSILKVENQMSEIPKDCAQMSRTLRNLSVLGSPRRKTMLSKLALKAATRMPGVSRRSKSKFSVSLLKAQIADMKSTLEKIQREGYNGTGQAAGAANSDEETDLALPDAVKLTQVDNVNSVEVETKNRIDALRLGLDRMQRLLAAETSALPSATPIDSDTSAREIRNSLRDLLSSDRPHFVEKISASHSIADDVVVEQSPTAHSGDKGIYAQFQPKDHSASPASRDAASRLIINNSIWQKTPLTVAVSTLIDTSDLHKAKKFRIEVLANVTWLESSIPLHPQMIEIAVSGIHGRGKQTALGLKYCPVSTVPSLMSFDFALPLRVPKEKTKIYCNLKMSMQIPCFVSLFDLSIYKLP